MKKRKETTRYSVNGSKIGLEGGLTKEAKELKKEIEIDTSKSPEKMSCQEILKRMRYGEN